MLSPDLLLLELTVPDGACRDINFAEHVSCRGTLGLLDDLARAGTFRNGENQDGMPVDLAQARQILMAVVGGETDQTLLQLFFRDLPLITNLMCWIAWDEPDRFAIELSFFPENHRPETFTLPAFQGWVKQLAKAAESPEYYVRIENASWQHGDVSSRSGILFSHRDAG